MKNRGFTPLQILKDTVVAVCNLESKPRTKHINVLSCLVRGKDSLQTCDATKKFVTGFSLIEVIVSVVLLTLVSAGTFSAFSIVQYVFDSKGHRTQAFNYTREALDRLRSNFGYNDSQMLVGAHQSGDTGVTLSGDLAVLVENPTTDFTYTVTEPEVGGYKKVTVRLKWREQ